MPKSYQLEINNVDNTSAYVRTIDTLRLIDTKENRATLVSYLIMEKVENTPLTGNTFAEVGGFNNNQVRALLYFITYGGSLTVGDTDNTMVLTTFLPTELTTDELTEENNSIANMVPFLFNGMNNVTSKGLYITLDAYFNHVSNPLGSKEIRLRVLQGLLVLAANSLEDRSNLSDNTIALNLNALMVEVFKFGSFSVNNNEFTFNNNNIVNITGVASNFYQTESNNRSIINELLRNILTSTHPVGSSKLILDNGNEHEYEINNVDKTHIERFNYRDDKLSAAIRIMREDEGLAVSLNDNVEETDLGNSVGTSTPVSISSVKTIEDPVAQAIVSNTVLLIDSDNGVQSFAFP